MKKNCLNCGRSMNIGVRWSKSQKKLKIFYVCEYCKLIYYKSDLKAYSELMDKKL